MARYAIIEDGVVTNIAIADADFAAAQGWVEASAGVGPGWTYADGAFTAPDPAPGTVEGVLAERARRLAMGFDYDFGDDRGVHRIGTTEDDLKGWDEVTKWANAAIATDNADDTLTILTETGTATVTPLEWQAILLAATAARQPLWAASFTLCATVPIPSDYTADSYWS